MLFHLRTRLLQLKLQSFSAASKVGSLEIYIFLSYDCQIFMSCVLMCVTHAVPVEFSSDVSKLWNIDVASKAWRVGECIDIVIGIIGIIGYVLLLFRCVCITWFEESIKSSNLRSISFGFIFLVWRVGGRYSLERQVWCGQSIEQSHGKKGDGLMWYLNLPAYTIPACPTTSPRRHSAPTYTSATLLCYLFPLRR